MFRKAGVVALMTALTLLQAAESAAQGPERGPQESVYDFLMKLHEFGRTNRMMNVPPQDGRLLQMLVKATGAKRIIEVGTSDGVSAIWMALGCEQTDGHIITLEIDAERAALARKHF